MSVSPKAGSSMALVHCRDRHSAGAGAHVLARPKARSSKSCHVLGQLVTHSPSFRLVVDCVGPGAHESASLTARPIASDPGLQCCTDLAAHDCRLP